MRTKTRRGVTLIECVIAMAITAMIVVSAMTLLGFARMQNELEQERTRAHQIVCQTLDLERYKLFTWTQSMSQQTIWDNGTPGDPSDDTFGTLEVVVRNPQTGEVLTQAPNPATLVEIEATITWTHRGPRLENKSMRETVISYKAP
ncbi:prepilin-type N-terminal cleavage/methylation domain-containing protein [Candidatus Sumerlaeota bacterium]|nr:prepilin-type N-terminal cleavage/methylation domain-containing protein [Candidatus Sumerlaeota bacterium]